MTDLSASALLDRACSRHREYALEVEDDVVVSPQGLRRQAKEARDRAASAAERGWARWHFRFAEAAAFLDARAEQVELSLARKERRKGRRP